MSITDVVLSVEIMKYVFVLQYLTVLLERQISHIKLSMAPALIQLERKGNWNSKDRITMWRVPESLLRRDEIWAVS